MNELASSQSHYLQQHAHNPVHWKQWNPRVWETAQSNNQLVVVSIGYAACHWCHVMERETFEQDDAAEVMNAHFQSIKVDREEHPDIDAIYMKAVQLMTRQGGWPLNVVCLPDGRPIWGATYVPKEKWNATLEQLAEMYLSNPEQVRQYAEQLTQGLVAIAIPHGQNQVDSFEHFFKEGVAKWQEQWDLDWGGESRAPKFMMPTHYNWLLQYGQWSQNTAVIDHVRTSLKRMTMGGTFDRFEGGFCRYSVDARWHIPHFEKMAYDNGLLLETFAQWHAYEPSTFSETILRKTAQFLATELQGEPGMYYGSLDADSINSVGVSEEGAYYAYTLSELKTVIDPIDWPYFSDYFQLNRWAYWEKDYYVPFQLDEDACWCERNQKSANWLTEKLQLWETYLRELRSAKSKPFRDTKCVTAWNAQIATGLQLAGSVLNDEKLKAQGVKAAKFIAENVNQEDGLKHQYGKTGAIGQAYCDDYAYVIKAYLQTYLTTWEETWLTEAKQLMDIALDQFWQPTAGYFQFTSNAQEVWVAPHFELEDNVIPSSNAIMLENLIRLGWYFSNEYYQNIAQEMSQNCLKSVDYFPGFTQWYTSILPLEVGYHSIQLSEAITAEEAQAFTSQFKPLQLIYRHRAESHIPINEQKAPAAPSAKYFQICKGKACFPPIDHLETALAHWNS